ncbi:MAG: YaeQ family protein [Caldimonas sp.]
MALKATIFKAQLQLADMDRGLYADHAVTLARHPSETDERMMVRLLAYALNVPADSHGGTLDFAKGLWDPDEPELWHKDLTGQIVHWIEVGQPDERRLLKASGRAGRVTVVSYSQSAPIWWSGIATKLTRVRNIAVWQIAASEAQALAELAQRSMQLQISVQDGTVWIGDGARSIEIVPLRLNA